MVKNYCTTREAARLLGISVRTVQLWVEKGRLKGWKTAGGHRRISRDAVACALEEKAADAAAQVYALPVLIVEDDAALLKLYRLRMARWPFPVTIYTAPNGYEGLVMVGEAAPRLLVCDLRLPGVNGFQIVRALCAMERYKEMHVVVVSGLAPEEIAAHGSLPPRVELMGKPIDFARLQGIAHDLWLRHSQPDSRAVALT
jgi:excisionase family DNA binding protein